MTQTLLIGVGGAVGVGSRFALGRLFARALATPYIEMTINAFGPSLLVTSVHLGLGPSLAAEDRVAATTGMLAGFMLLATLNSDMIQLMEEGRRARCLAIIAAAAAGCLVAGGLGLWMARLTG